MFDNQRINILKQLKYIKSLILFWILRYQIEVDCSSGQFKSAKLKDKESTINVPSFLNNIEKRKRLMHQVLTFVGRWSAAD